MISNIANASAARARLAGRPKWELRVEANEHGVDEAVIEQWSDGDMTNDQFIGHIIARQPQQQPQPQQQQQQQHPHPQPPSVDTQKIRTELEKLNLKDLISRAEDEGADDQEVENATESDTPRQSLIELIIAKVVVAKRQELRTKLDQPLSINITNINAGGSEMSQDGGAPGARAESEEKVKRIEAEVRCAPVITHSHNLFCVFAICVVRIFLRSGLLCGSGLRVA